MAERGFNAVAPELFWRQEPEGRPQRQLRTDWQHGLGFYQAYDRDAGTRDVKDAANVVAALPQCIGRVAVLAIALVGW